MGEYIPIRSLKPGMKDLTLMFIVLDVGRPNITKENHEVRTVKVADKTGAVNLSLWDEPGKLISSGDIIRMTKGYTNVWKGCLTLYVGKTGEFHKVGDFCLIFSEVPFLSEFNPDHQMVSQQQQHVVGGPLPPGVPPVVPNQMPLQQQGPPPQNQQQMGKSFGRGNNGTQNAPINLPRHPNGGPGAVPNWGNRGTGRGMAKK